MSRAARWWIVFGLCNVVVALALIWTTRVVVGLERSELRARAETGYQESLRLAMWRMDSWLALLLASEAARPRDSEQEHDYIELRFQIDAQGLATSEQTERLEPLRPYLALTNIHAAMTQADALVSTKLAPSIEAATAITDADRSNAQTIKTQNEFDARVACGVPRPSGSELTGRQVVVWLGAPAPASVPALAFLRRAGENMGFTGYFLNWPRIEERLLFEIRDLFPDAKLERVMIGGKPIDPLGRGLANIPVTLVTKFPGPIAATGITGGRAALGLAWLAMIVASIAVGATLRSSIELGERRRRFVSAVTHELRTPLTTFQLYSEMLADGLVQDEDKRQQYLETLKDESQRLSAMVANVLAHAQLEGKHEPRRLEQTNLGKLIARLRPPLERRVAASKLTLEIENRSPETAPLTVDSEAISQILGNLVDNAAKYASGSNPSVIQLGVAAQNGSLILTVRDHGPGIPREKAKAIFAAFDRGGRDPSDPVPGIGLGLALARGLARDMGGELTLENPNEPGALFRVELPSKCSTPAN